MEHRYDFIVWDPPELRVSVWAAYVSTAALLAAPAAKVLFTSVPQLFGPIAQLALAAGLSSEQQPLRRHRFVPVEVGCMHRFGIFTNYDCAGLDCSNPEQLAQEDPLDEPVDEIDLMLADMRMAVIADACCYSSSDDGGEDGVATVNARDAARRALTARKEAAKRAAASRASMTL
eukprot:TRINITY_DN56116_c0_g1_i1.p1 TRINITY_DN56116_c0_g1~~TRINITY_DN56116_c0_g1_i1.p1  ORF type:complete len:175 (+),score=36.11 TRINITY_DN56116_c0_g1_i1:1-525(+)